MFLKDLSKYEMISYQIAKNCSNSYSQLEGINNSICYSLSHFMTIGSMIMCYQVYMFGLVWFTRRDMATVSL